jgi:Rrf2 family protein
MLSIARKSEGKTAVNLREISEETAISRRYLEQLVTSLKNASLLESRSGRAGGYVLAKPPEEITVGDIVTATIGPVSFVHCVLFPETCPRGSECESRLIWALMSIRAQEVLFRYSLKDLANKACVNELRQQVKLGMQSAYFNAGG